MPRKTRSSAPLWKLISAVLLMLAIAGGGMLLLREQDDSPRQTAAQTPARDAAGPTGGTEESGAQADPSAGSEAAGLIAELVSLAREGRIPDANFVVGKTSSEEVEAAWQAPERISQSGQAVYADYPDRFATVGYRDGIVTDLRSDDAGLRGIRYLDILSELGQADSVKMYKDEKVDQIILGYGLPGGYTLRWVLPKPWSAEASQADGSGGEDAENPALDHISLIGPARAGNDGAKKAAADEKAAAPAELPAAAVPDGAAPSPEEAADSPLADMTLDEKIGQMIVAGVEGRSLRQTDKALIRERRIGGVIFYADNIESAPQTKAFAESIQAANPNDKLPLFVSVDQEGGRVARLKGVDKVPTAAAIGRQGDAAYARSVGELLGEQLLSQGFNLDYAPVLDVNSNPDNPVIGDRSFGASAALVSKLGIPVMQGLESKKVIPVVKHFPGHGDTSVDSHVSLPVVNKSTAQLDKLELVPFKKAIAEGADVVMIAHILLPKLDKQYPSSMSKAVITDLLREKLGFEGVVMTDDMTMGAIAENYGLGEAAVQSVLAGSDIILVAHEAENAVQAIDAIKKAVRSGKISEERIDESVARIIELKQKYLQ
ncbi:beta-N-acetylhexosaminidase [Saccharibacillus alkalitolerans]|uniref:beta-N-acetylhexosaminidase n=1 Tax=Saccharibacillus alkalitolerans TaxID=2705290 RepID=A0ABX0F8Q0_9BACL|nr:beta-N-acetylhexosaminidase [Saccharibacillus alkalitolerans]NGZ77346.1 beta-N-acetylhexosaminidase [Saccharibacillus alkalitolerans]